MARTHEGSQESVEPRKAATQARQSAGLHLVVAMPALDEERSIESVIAGVPRDCAAVARTEILVVDDGSRDRTGELARAAGAEVIRHDQPRGVGGAFQSALVWATERGADLLVTIDADGQFDPRDIPKLIAPIAADEADFATASRFTEASLEPRMPWIKRWGNERMSALISRLTRREFADVSCGFRCYSRRAMLSLNPMGSFTYVQEVILNLSVKGLRIAEIPVRVRGEREFGESRVASNLWRYALFTSGIIFRTYRDYYPMRFFGVLSLAILVPALLLELFFAGHYLVTGAFSPHKWAGFVGAGLAVLGLVIFMMGMLADQLNRHRIYLEELLYRARK